MSTAFPPDAKVRFTQERLSILTPRDRQGLAGRIGVIQIDNHFFRKPTVSFPADGAKLALRLFRVDPRHLELVESPPDRKKPANHADRTPVTPITPVTPRAPSAPSAADVRPSVPVGGSNLTQEELDALFG